MPNGPGVSVSRLASGRWRVRWREPVVEDGIPRRIQRERTVADERTAVDLRARVLRALETGQVYEDEVREVVHQTTLDDVLDGYLRAASARGAAPNTIDSLGGRTTRILRTYRRILGLPEDRAVPGGALTRSSVVELTLRLRGEGLAEGTIYGTIQTLLAAWTWASDDPDGYPGIAPAPRDTSALLPYAPVYSAGPSPTMAECDAVLRIVATRRAPWVALSTGTIARCTGLRVGQVLGIQVRDVDLDAMTLRIRTGKSRREKAENRVIPYAPALHDLLARLVLDADGRPQDAGLIPRRSDAVPGARGGPDRTLRRAWEEATAQGHVRREVWAPEGRAQARPDHAFRAAFQAHLAREGVRDGLIDLLVGHAGGLRERHYVAPEERMALLREAVSLVPPIDWGTA